MKLFQNLFYKPKYETNSDRIMQKHLFSTITIVLVCLAAISFSAYAFFASSVGSGSSFIKASRFNAIITIKTSQDVPVAQGELKEHTFQPGNYIVTITPDSNTTGTGFCIIQVGSTKYHTQQLGVDVSAANQQRMEVSFALDIQDEITIQFETKWGTSSFYNSDAPNNPYYIQNSNPLKVIVFQATQNMSENTDESDSEEPTTGETAPMEPTTGETTPEDTTPEEPTTGETTPEDTTPEDPTTGETTPEDTTPEDPTTGETTPEDTTPEDPTTGETTPEDTTPEDSTSGETTA